MHFGAFRRFFGLPHRYLVAKNAGKWRGTPYVGGDMNLWSRWIERKICVLYRGNRQGFSRQQLEWFQTHYRVAIFRSITFLVSTPFWRLFSEQPTRIFTATFRMILGRLPCYSISIYLVLGFNFWRLFSGQPTGIFTATTRVVSDTLPRHNISIFLVLGFNSLLAVIFWALQVPCVLLR